MMENPLALFIYQLLKLCHHYNLLCVDLHFDQQEDEQR